MKAMSDNMKDVETQTVANSRESTDRDAAVAVIMAELAELIKLLTAAAESTWAATSLLEVIAAKSSIQQANKSSKTQAACCVLTAVLALIAVFDGSHNAFRSSGVNSASCVAEMKSVCGLMIENIDRARYSQNTTLAELNQRFLALETALQNNDGRIDHVW